MDKDVVDVKIAPILTSRAQELQAFEADVNTVYSQAVTALQRLPVRLRRRAASHNFRRLPKRLRKFVNPVSGTAAKAGKHGVRKRRIHRSQYRRTAAHLFTAATRQKRLALSSCILQSVEVSESKKKRRVMDAETAKSSQWLPTHLWHAKRFHMETQWGWRLPRISTDKMCRATFRGVTQGCVLWDASYLACLQFHSTVAQQSILDVLLPLWPEPLRPSTATWQAFVDGKVEVDCFLYTPGGFPFQALGPARAIWFRDASVKERPMTLWLWIHPSILSGLVAILESHFHLQRAPGTGPSPHLLFRDQLLLRLFASGEIPRFSLIGPDSHQLLQHILVEMAPSGGALQGSSNSQWAQWRALRNVAQSAAVRPAGVVLHLPNCGATKPVLRQGEQRWHHMTANVNENNVQVESNRELTESMSSQSTLGPNSGSVLLIHQTAPVLLNTAGQNSCYGWDLCFLPSQRKELALNLGLLHSLRFVRQLWICAVYGGAVAVGRESLVMVGAPLLHSWRHIFPAEGSQAVDTKAARDVLQSGCTERHIKDLRRPRNRRVVYEEMGTPAPFQMPWGTLLSHWDAHKNSYGECECRQSQLQDFYVLRDWRLLCKVFRPLLEGRLRLTVEQMLRYDPNLAKALLPVEFEHVSRGRPESEALICVPTMAEDLLLKSSEEICTDDDEEDEERPITSTSKMASTPPLPLSKCLFQCVPKPVVGFVDSSNLPWVNGKGRGTGVLSLLGLVVCLEQLHNLKCFKPLTGGRSTSGSNCLYLVVKNPATKTWRLVAIRMTLSM